MNEFKPTVGIEPTDQYAKARQDVMQAFDSVRKLEPWQREQLAKDLFGAEVAATIYVILQQNFGGDHYGLSW